jgi:hypothetical protein
MSHWEEDHAWSALFDRQVKMAIGPHVIGNATVEEDRDRATDLVLATERVRIACRIRRWSKQSCDKWGGQFTIRSHRVSGVRTELAKILDGWGDMFFYGWGCPQSVRLRDWYLIDLEVFRSWYSEAALRGSSVRAAPVKNHDGSSGDAFWIHQLPDGGVIASGVGLQLRDDSLVNV